MALELWTDPRAEGIPPRGMEAAVAVGANVLARARGDVLMSASSCQSLLERTGELESELWDCECELNRPEASCSEMFGIWREAIRVYAYAMERLPAILQGGRGLSRGDTASILSALSVAARGLRTYAQDQTRAQNPGARHHATPLGHLLHVGRLLERRIAQAKGPAAEDARLPGARRRYLEVLQRVEKELHSIEIPDFPGLYREAELRLLEIEMGSAVSAT